MRAAAVIAVLGLSLSACAGVSVGPGKDWLRDSPHYAPECGSVATGANPDCTRAENGGRTRG